MKKVSGTIYRIEGREITVIREDRPPRVGAVQQVIDVASSGSAAIAHAAQSTASARRLSTKTVPDTNGTVAVWSARRLNCGETKVLCKIRFTRDRY